MNALIDAFIQWWLQHAMTKLIFHSLRVGQEHRRERCRRGWPQSGAVVCAGLSKKFGPVAKADYQRFEDTFSQPGRDFYATRQTEAAAPCCSNFRIHSYTETDDTKGKRDVCHMTRRKRKYQEAQRWHPAGHRSGRVYKGLFSPSLWRVKCGA